MTYNDLKLEWLRLKEEHINNPNKDILEKLKVIDKKLRELDKQLQRYYTPRGNYGDKKEN